MLNVTCFWITQTNSWKTKTHQREHVPSFSFLHRHNQKITCLATECLADLLIFALLRVFQCSQSMLLIIVYITLFLDCPSEARARCREWIQKKQIADTARRPKFSELRLTWTPQQLSFGFWPSRAISRLIHYLEIDTLRRSNAVSEPIHESTIFDETTWFWGSFTFRKSTRFYE